MKEVDLLTCKKQELTFCSPFYLEIIKKKSWIGNRRGWSRAVPGLMGGMIYLIQISTVVLNLESHPAYWTVSAPYTTALYKKLTVSENIGGNRILHQASRRSYFGARCIVGGPGDAMLERLQRKMDYGMQALNLILVRFLQRKISNKPSLSKIN